MRVRIFEKSFKNLWKHKGCLASVYVVSEKPIINTWDLPIPSHSVGWGEETIIITDHARLRTTILNKPWIERPIKLDNSKLGSTQQQKICWYWHVARIISSQKMYGLYARKHHIAEMRGDVTDAGRQPTDRTNEDRATQPIWNLGAESCIFPRNLKI